MHTQTALLFRWQLELFDSDDTAFTTASGLLLVCMHLCPLPLLLWQPEGLRHDSQSFPLSNKTGALICSDANAWIFCLHLPFQPYFPSCSVIGAQLSHKREPVSHVGNSQILTFPIGSSSLQPREWVRISCHHFIFYFSSPFDIKWWV